MSIDATFCAPFPPPSISLYTKTERWPGPIAMSTRSKHSPLRVKNNMPVHLDLHQRTEAHNSEQNPLYNALSNISMLGLLCRKIGLCFIHFPVTKAILGQSLANMKIGLWYQFFTITDSIVDFYGTVLCWRCWQQFLQPLQLLLLPLLLITWKTSSSWVFWLPVDSPLIHPSSLYIALIEA